MRNDMGRLENENAVETGYERAQGRMKAVRKGTTLGLLKILAFGLMLGCATAYASEPSSPAPVTATKSEAHHTNATKNSLVSADVGDEITDWSIAILAIIAGSFFAVNYFETRKIRRQYKDPI